MVKVIVLLVRQWINLLNAKKIQLWKLMVHYCHAC